MADYTEDVTFIMPGQADIFNGISDFRTAIVNLATELPPGFEVVSLRHIESSSEVVTICAWKSESVKASQLAALFRFRDNKIYEERWFMDTEQWKGAF